MPIRSHEVRGEMIHVDLGSDAFMAFPLYMVDKVEDAGKEVILTPSFSASNKIVAGRVPTTEGSYPVKGQRPGGRGGNSQGNDMRLIDRSEMHSQTGREGGVTAHRPLSSHRAANRRGLGTTGRSGVAQESGGQGDGGYLGATKQGARHVIGGMGSRTGPDGKPRSPSPVSVTSHTTPAGNKKKGG
jgi:hypothetical protein